MLRRQHIAPRAAHLPWLPCQASGSAQRLTVIRRAIATSYRVPICDSQVQFVFRCTALGIERIDVGLHSSYAFAEGIV